MWAARTVVPVERLLIQAASLRARAQDGTGVEADNLHPVDGRVACKLLHQEHPRVLGQCIGFRGLARFKVVDGGSGYIDEVSLPSQPLFVSRTHSADLPEVDAVLPDGLTLGEGGYMELLHLPFSLHFASRSVRCNG